MYPRKWCGKSWWWIWKSLRKGTSWNNAGACGCPLPVPFHSWGVLSQQGWVTELGRNVQILLCLCHSWRPAGFEVLWVNVQEIQSLFSSDQLGKWWSGKGSSSALLCYTNRPLLESKWEKMPKTPVVSLSVFIQRKLRKSVHFAPIPTACTGLRINCIPWWSSALISGCSCLISGGFSFYPQIFLPGKWGLCTHLKHRAKRDKGWNAEAAGG